MSPSTLPAKSPFGTGGCLQVVGFVTEVNFNPGMKAKSVMMVEESGENENNRLTRMK